MKEIAKGQRGHIHPAASFMAEGQLNPRGQVDAQFRALLESWFPAGKRFNAGDVMRAARKYEFESLRASHEMDAFARAYRAAYCESQTTCGSWNMFSFRDRARNHIERSISKYGGKKMTTMTQVTEASPRSSMHMKRRVTRPKYFYSL